VNKICYILSLLTGLLLLHSCTSTKNNAGTRWYHSFNTRFNVYFNGEQAYREALKNLNENYTENYTETIMMFPVSSLPKDKPNTGGSFDKAIEKSVKAIKTHSIQTKPAKKAGKQKDAKYQEFMSRIEYNPFLYNAWFLMAQSQFYNGDFLQAASSFSYISRLYASQPEISNNAKIWKARSYGEMGWYFEAEDILSKINREQLKKKQNNWWSTVKADILVKQKRYEEAIPYMQTAIGSEKSKLQKNREKYLLGQMYKSLGQKSMAYKTFSEINSSSLPYVLLFNAKIRQTEVYPGGDTTKVTGQLRKMAKNAKNKDYLDQIYYALGNVYMTVPDTLKAVASYEEGVAKSTQNGLDKALNQIQLGDIYFHQRKYVSAQPNYSEALGQLKKEHEAYPRVSKRSEVLDELVVFHEAVHLQDSLLALSKMSEEEQLAVVKKIIEDLIKKEEEEAKKSQREDFLAQREESRQQNINNRRPATSPGGGIVAPPNTENLFYFYNPQIVAVGKNSFQQKWGRRKLEDDWRRRNKTNPVSDMFAENQQNEDETVTPEQTENDLPKEEGNTAPDAATAEQINDPKDPQFYLQQIPKTEEDVEASNLIIADGLFNMALIYKDKLEDGELALETFNTLDSRYPENENKLEAYYQTYLIYLRANDIVMANLYKQKIRETFPDSEYAIAMANPDYEYNMKMMDVIQDSLYRNTYQSYLDEDFQTVRNNYEQASNKYSQSKLMPKFMFLNALSYVQTKEGDIFKERLKELINRYPDADVSVLASEMMKGFQRGLALSASGSGMLARGNLFNMRFGNVDNPEETESLTFSPETNSAAKLLLIYPKETLDDNLLLYTVASYNFGNFKLNDFDLEKTNIGEINMLQVKGFNNMDEVLQYISKINQPDGYMPDLGNALVTVPISLENYEILMKGKTLEEYMQFFENQYGKENSVLIEKWKQKQTEELEPVKEEVEVNDASPLPDTEEQIEEESDKADTETVPSPVVATPELQNDSIVGTEEKISETDEKIDELYNKASETVDKANDVIDKVANDPIRAFLNLFKRNKSNNAIDEYAREQEKAEKERQKKLKAEKAEKEKKERELARQKEKEQKALKKQEEDEAKAALKQKEQEEKDAIRQKEEKKKAQEAEKKRIKKEKEEARKQKQAEYKANQKRKAEERKQKEKERKEAQKKKKQGKS
jgi:tetratricopeptide (TPR) repeat protein